MTLHDQLLLPALPVESDPSRSQMLTCSRLKKQVTEREAHWLADKRVWDIDFPVPRVCQR